MAGCFRWSTLQDTGAFMDESDSVAAVTPEIPVDSPQFSREHYDRLVESSEDNDGMKAWNEWKNDNPAGKVLLRGAPILDRNLAGINLQNAHLIDADLRGANLKKAKLHGAMLIKANLQEAHLERANLQGAFLHAAKLQGAFMHGVNLQKAMVQGANFYGARLYGAKLSQALFCAVDLRWVALRDADIRGTNFSQAIVDGATDIDTDKVDRETDFSGVGLGNAAVKRGLRQVLEYNIRRFGWREWYKKHPVAAVVGRPFWWVSDYGFSMGRILGTLGGLSVLYALVYRMFPGFLDGVAIGGLWHALYFSVVTTTTLGFGDIHANPQSPVGQGVLMSQVLLGYLLLGAVITRLAVLFSSDGPALGFYRERSFWRRMFIRVKHAWRGFGRRFGRR